MKFQRSKDWWIAMARREGDAMVGAGYLAIDPAPEEGSRGAAENRIAFGKLVNLMRRRSGYSMEQLAEIADLDASDLLVIEDGAGHPLEPRTVYRLSQAFGIPQGRLMQLAGLSAANDDAGLRREAVRFAARSESLHKLTPEENEALEAFVAALSDPAQKLPK